MVIFHIHFKLIEATPSKDCTFGINWTMQLALWLEHNDPKNLKNRLKSGWRTSKHTPQDTLKGLFSFNICQNFISLSTKIFANFLVAAQLWSPRARGRSYSVDFGAQLIMGWALLHWQCIRFWTETQRKVEKGAISELKEIKLWFLCKWLKG